MPKQKNIIDRMNEFLFDPIPKDMTEPEKKMVLRYRDAYTHWLENPLSSDLQIRDYIMNAYNISATQSYRDIANIKLLLGNVRSAGKEWHRHRVNYLLEKAAQMAINGDPQRATALSKVATALIKNNKLEIEEGEQIPFDEIVPPAFEPVSDPTVIGLKPIENLRERIDKLKEKYIAEIEIADVPFETVTNE